jgi:FkbM family methyltransferase
MPGTEPELLVASRSYDGMVQGLTRRVPRLAARIIIRLHRRLVGRRLAPVDIARGVRMAVSPQDNLGHHLFYYGCYEPEQVELWERLLERGTEQVVLDVGANMGYYSLLAAASPRVARVVSFEPNPMVLPVLRYNVAANPGIAAKMQVVEAAAGDAEGTVPFHQNYAEHNFGLGSLQARTEDDVTVDVPLVRLDRHLLALGLTRVDLVKIDVEGAELSVVKGLLGYGRPRLVVEVHPGLLPLFGASVADLFTTLRQAGYGLQRVLPDGSLSSVEGLGEIAWVLAEPANQS